MLLLSGNNTTKAAAGRSIRRDNDPNFPFEFSQREFSYNQHIPELRTENTILHIGRSSAPDRLPYKSKYKEELSYHNQLLRRQLILDSSNTPPIGLESFYGLLVFGGRKEIFSVVQFPEPGYSGIAESIMVPQIVVSAKSEEAEKFERKKAALKEKILAHGIGEV